MTKEQPVGSIREWTPIAPWLLAISGHTMLLKHTPKFEILDADDEAADVASWAV